MLPGNAGERVDDVGLSSLVGAGVLLGVGWVLVAFGTVRVVTPTPSTADTLIAISVPAVLGITFFAGGTAILRHDLHDRTARIARWTVLGVVVITAAVVVTVLGTRTARFGFSRSLFVLTGSAASGAVLGFMVGLYDANQHRLRGDLERASDRATRESQRRSVLNRVLRHDTRHQAQLIRGHAEQLRDGDLGPEEAAERVIRGTDRMVSVADQARKLESLHRRDGVQRGPVDLVSIVKTACDRATDRYSGLVVDCDLPRERRVASTQLLTDAIEHLLINAAEHNDADGPRASVTLDSVEDATLPVRLHIVDDGPGMPATEPVVGDVSAESDLRHSSGFGLWFVKWVVEETGGEIDVESPEEAGVGTRITLSLPAAGP
ncbi:MAG: sensor histidine kinase [Halanaeroarchaeum sp.]